MAGPDDNGPRNDGSIVDGHGGIGRDDIIRDGETLRDAGDAPLEVSEEYVEEARFELDEEERLPWLESADYEDTDSSSDTGKLVGVILIAVLLLGLLLAALWWLSNRGPDPELAADGSTIAAPKGDYKERPDDPGGRTFEGSGDVAPAVGEGETREGRLAEAIDDADRDAPRPRNGAEGDTTSAGSSTTEAGNVSGTASASGGVGVQIAAYSTKESAERGWSQLSRQTEALAGFKYRIVQGEADIGTVYRLQAVAGDIAAANALCGKLRADGLACQVKR